MLHFKEPLDLAIEFNNLQLIDSKKAKLQNISILKHPLLGKLLIINNEVQHVEAWAPLYHEIVVHLPAAFIPKIENVLILGGGSLFAATEVLKYNSVKKVIMIDHDKNVIDIVRKNYVHAKKVLNDKRFELRIDDAFVGVKKVEQKFDLIVNDSVDLIKYGKSRKINLLNLLCSKLSQEGICSDLVYRHIFERITTKKTLNLLKKEFYNAFSLIAVPEYPGIFHLLCLWSRANKRLEGSEIKNAIQKKLLTQKKTFFQYYNPRYINYYKYFPPYLERVLNDEFAS